jgi:hypothetical protein
VATPKSQHIDLARLSAHAGSSQVRLYCIAQRHTDLARLSAHAGSSQLLEVVVAPARCSKSRALFAMSGTSTGVERMFSVVSLQLTDRNALRKSSMQRKLQPRRGARWRMRGS